MKERRLRLIGIKLSVVLAVFSLVVVPLFHPATALAGDSLTARGCEAGAPNLVKNPGFDSIVPQFGMLFFDANAINDWSATSVQRELYRPLVQGPAIGPDGERSYFSTNVPIPSGVYDGSHAASLPGFRAPASYGGTRPTIYGDLAPVPSAQYRLSARLYKDDQAGSPPAAVEMRLYNSSNQAESTPVRATISDASSWGLVTGVVDVTSSYDKVLVRFWKDGDWVLVDDVIVCKAAQLPISFWDWLTGILGGVMGVLGIAGLAVVIMNTRRGKTGGTSKKRAVAVGDFNNDGKPDFKVSENESPYPQIRSFLKKNNLLLGIVSVVLAVAAIYIVSASGGIWKNKSFTPVAVPTDSKDITKTQAPVTAKTCKDHATVPTGYKLFYSDTYKYCISYPSDWPVDSKDPASVTFGTERSEPLGGWLRINYLSDKTVAQRTELLMSNFREPAGPCTTSDSQLGGQVAKKLDCIGAREGEHHIYYLVAQGKDLLEFSYIEGTDVTVYKVIFDNVLIGDY